MVNSPKTIRQIKSYGGSEVREPFELRAKVANFLPPSSFDTKFFYPQIVLPPSFFAATGRNGPEGLQKDMKGPKGLQRDPKGSQGYEGL